jgi:adenosylcobinamide-phosphate synthase
MSRIGGRALAVASGLAIDRVMREPPDSVHPVAAFGRLMGRVEGRVWRDARLPGVVYAVGGVALGALAGRAVRSIVVATSLAAAGRELRRVAADVDARCLRGDLDGARAVLPALVGRDPSRLDESGIAAAVIESLAENTVDAVVAPALWALAAGAPGVAAYRAVNTMDAMVGHRSERYRRFGWAAARLDDAANYLPARVFAVLVAIVRAGDGRRILQAVRGDAPAHPSPNAGVAEAAMAGALGRSLGGPLWYGDRREDRPRLGDGPRPVPRDIRAAIVIVDRVELVLIAALVVLALADRAVGGSSGGLFAPRDPSL